MSGVATAQVARSEEVLASGPAPTDDEVAGSRRLAHDADRRDWLAARVLARRLVAEHTGRDAGEVGLAQVCATCGGPHGRPSVVGGGAHVGWSHTAGLVAVVVADAPCAVDLESLPRLRGQVLPLDLLPAPERAWAAARPDPVRAFAELWVRKEVLVKLGEVTLDDALALDVRASLDARPVLGRVLVPLAQAPSYDAVGVWAT